MTNELNTDAEVMEALLRGCVVKSEDPDIWPRRISSDGELQFQQLHLVMEWWPATELPKVPATIVEEPLEYHNKTALLLALNAGIAVSLGFTHAPIRIAGINGEDLQYFAEGRWCFSGASLDHLIKGIPYPVKRFIEPEATPEEPTKKYLTDINDLEKCEGVSVKQPNGLTVSIVRDHRWTLDDYSLIDTAIRLGMSVEIVEERE
jgi:hypothetical protein